MPSLVRMGYVFSVRYPKIVPVGAPIYREAKTMPQAVSISQTHEWVRQTYGDLQASFFAQSEHDRWRDETEPDWSQLDRLLPDQKTLSTPAFDAVMTFKQDKGVVIMSCVMRDDEGEVMHDSGWTFPEHARATKGEHEWWTLECLESARHAQRLIQDAIPALPRVQKGGDKRDDIAWRDATLRVY